MSKKDWIWMGHAAHLCVGDKCRFRLATYVNGYIVSTVGEYFPDEIVRRMFLETKIRMPNPFRPNDKENAIKVLCLKGDAFDANYLNIFGYEEIGLDRLYETMVFEAEKSKHKCCPYKNKHSSDSFDMDGYNNADDATEGHYEMCEKWDKETLPHLYKREEE